MRSLKSRQGVPDSMSGKTAVSLVAESPKPKAGMGFPCSRGVSTAPREARARWYGLWGLLPFSACRLSPRNVLRPCHSLLAEKSMPTMTWMSGSPDAEVGGQNGGVVNFKNYIGTLQ